MVYGEVRPSEGPSWCWRLCPRKVFGDTSGQSHPAGDRRELVGHYI